METAVQVRKTIKGPVLYRTIEIKRESVNESSRTVELSFSSEEPVGRWFGTEILDHNPGSVRLDRLLSKGPLLTDHDPTKQIGVIESAEIADGRGKAVVRFSKSAKAEEIYQDILDGIRANVSVGYQIHQMVLVEVGDTEEVYRATDWEPFEVSIVSIPADITVGVGRTALREQEITVITREKEQVMDKEKKAEVLSDADIDAIKVKTRNDELARTREIEAIGETFNMKDLARQFKDNGKSVDEFQRAVLSEMEKSGKIKAVDPSATEIGMSERDAKEFSFVRLINAMITNDWSEAGAEREASLAVGKKLGKRAQGMFIPNEVLKRDLSKGTANAGGYTVATDLLAGSFIDVLRNRMMVRQLGATILSGMTGDVAIPRQSAAATAYWVTEGVAPTESQQTFGQISLTPKSVSAFTDITRQLLLQSSMDVEQLVRNDLAQILAIAIDSAAIAGSGSGGQPTGITNTAGIGAVAGGTNGLAPAWSHIVGLESAIAMVNGDVGKLSYLTSPKVRGKLKQTQKGTYLNMIWDEAMNDPGMGVMNGYRAAVTNQIPDNLTKGTSSGVCSAIIFGNWADLIIAEWGALDILVDPFTASSTGTVRVRAFQSLDVGVRNAASFAAMLDALAA